MGRITEEASATVTMNMEPARKALDEGKNAAKAFREELESLMAVPEGERSLDQKLRIAQLTEDIAKADKEIEKAEKKLKTFRETMKNLNSASLNELYKASKELEAQIKRLKPGTEEYIAANHDLKMVNTRLKDLRDGWKAVSAETEKTVKTTKESVSLMDNLSKKFQKYWSMFDVAMRTITGVSMKFRQCAEDAAELDDVYSDVMKTTNLLHEEVEDLDKELMNIDTRTAREQLLLLARDAGKVGVEGKEDILGFVRAAEKINVALGEDLGEGAIRNLAKISDVLGYTKSMGIEKALLSIGSAVNAVGQASTAAESYLVDFTQRMAGVGHLANISAANIIGFASGLDQSAMRVEMSSTAFQQFMMKLYSEPEKFAQYANKSVSEFADLMRNDANAAIIEVLKGFREIGDMSEMTKHFDEMNLDGARTVTVLSSMAANLDAVIEAQALANEEFEKATSIDEEYATKNNNLQAQLEKARKEFHNASIALGQSLNPILLKSTKATTYLIKALANYGKEIKTVLIVLAALTVALKAKAIWMKVVATWNATLRTGSLALAAAQALLAGNVTRAAAAWKLMNTAMKASVIGVATSLIAGLIIVVERLIKKRKEVNAVQAEGLKLEDKINKAGEEEISKILRLRKTVEDQTRSYFERNMALKELKELVPDYQASLTEEGVLINNNTEALDKYIQKIKQSALEKLMADEIADLAMREDDAQQAKQNLQQQLNEEKGKYYGDYYMGAPANQGAITMLEELLAADEIVLSDIAEERKRITDKIQRMIDSGDLTIDPSKDKKGGGGGEGDKKAFDQRIKELQKQFKTEERELRISLLKREISEAQYDAKVYAAHMENLRLRLEAARKYGQDDTDIQNEFLDMQIKAIEKQSKEQQKILDALEKQRRERAKRQEEEERKQVVDKAKSMASEQEILEKNLQEVRERLGRENWKEEYDFEMWKLQQLHDKGLVSERDYQESKLRIKLDYAKKAATQVNSIAEQASNFVTALKEAESAQLEAEYQKQLTAAGDNAEERERIETEYEQKKLDLQKKYADTEMVINIAKAIAAGALAAIEAFAAAGNPILGAVFAAIIAATTAAEVATIIAQRNAIKNTSVSGSSTPSIKTGQRTMTGYAEGGYTEGHATLTTVGEKGVEYVIPNWMVRKNPVMVANLERYRKAGSHGKSGSVSRGFADGGFTTPTDDVVTAQSNLAIEAAVYNGIRAALEGEWLRAYLVRKDLSEIDAQDNRFKKQTARWN